MIDELVLADATLPRFVYWEDKLYALPGSLESLVNFNLLTCKETCSSNLLFIEFKRRQRIRKRLTSSKIL